MKLAYPINALLIIVVNLSALTPEEIAEKAFPASVMLVMVDENGKPDKTGSGFFVSRNIIVTNYHVVEGTHGGIVKCIGSSRKSKITDIVAVNQAFDIALLRVEQSSGAKIVLGDSTKLKIGQPIFVVGSPRGLEGTFSNGLVSSIRRFGDDYLVQMTAPISSGSSGGPVLDENGEVVGVSVGIFQGGQNLNFAIPSEYVNSLISLLSRGEEIGSFVASASNKFFSPKVNLSSSLHQNIRHKDSLMVSSIHELDLIDHARSDTKFNDNRINPIPNSNKEKSNARGVFIMTR